MESYHTRYIEKVQAIESIVSKHVAVLGCSYGVECQLLLEAGARSVTGVDLDEHVGRDHPNDRIRYIRRPVEDTGLNTGQFDIVYSVAVFEHVKSVELAYREAARICKSGGLIFIISSPVWNAPYGNHMNGILPLMPWCHLLYSPTALEIEIEKFHPEVAQDKSRMDWIIQRMYDPIYYNRYPSSVYRNACANLADVSVVHNSCWPAAIDDDLKKHFLPLCEGAGYNREEVLVGAHYFEARKGHIAE